MSMPATADMSAFPAFFARRGIHYGWVVASVTFLTMLVTAGAVGLARKQRDQLAFAADGHFPPVEGRAAGAEQEGRAGQEDGAAARENESHGRALLRPPSAQAGSGGGN